MAEHATSGAPMDYDEHQQTYKGFVAFTGLTIITVVNILLTLIIIGFGSGGFWVAMLVLALALAAAAVGAAMKGSWKPAAGVCILAVLAVILTVG